MLLLLPVQLFVVIFLGEKETKRLFIPDPAEMAETSSK